MAEEPKLQNNADIQDALAKLGVEPGAPQAPQGVAEKKSVEGMTFDTDDSAPSYKALKFYNETSTPKVIKLIMKYSGGLIKEENHASYVLLFVSIIFIAISIFLFLPNNKKIPISLPPNTTIPSGLKAVRNSDGLMSIVREPPKSSD